MIPEAVWVKIRTLADDLAAASRLREAVGQVDAVTAEDLLAVSEAMSDDIAHRVAELRREISQ